MEEVEGGREGGREGEDKRKRVGGLWSKEEGGEVERETEKGVKLTRNLKTKHKEYFKNGRWSAQIWGDSDR